MAIVVPLTVPIAGLANVLVQKSAGSKRTVRTLKGSSPSPNMVIWGEVLLERIVVGENEVELATYEVIIENDEIKIEKD